MEMEVFGQISTGKVKYAGNITKEKFNEARKTGNPVLIARWVEECKDKSEECSVDYVTKYAMPDGSTEMKRQHIW